MIESTFQAVFFSFVINSVVAALFFYSVLEDLTRKDTLRRNALLVSFSGTVVGGVSSILIALIPSSIISMDFSMGLVFVTWVLLLRYHCGSSTWEALTYSFLATIIYTVVLVLSSSLFILILIGRWL